MKCCRKYKHNHKLALAVTEKFNEGLQKSDTLALLEKEQRQVQKAIDGFLSAIAAGIVTKSTKEKLLSLEQQNDESSAVISVPQLPQKSFPLSMYSLCP